MVETAAFTSLLVLSVAATAWRSNRIVRNILAARPDPGSRLAPLAPRLRRAAWEVLFQAKVIRERPLPGLAHALVFWGFLAFSLATLDHLAAGFGVEVIPAASSLGKAYFALVAVLALAVAMAIAGLAARRFLARPRWLGTVSPESGVIALLIFLLMFTYLAGYFAGEPRVVWWLHTLCLLIFLPLIPHTKHLHLVFGPLAVFLAHDQLSHIPPLAGDEDFGLDSGKDLTRLAAFQAYTCVECGRCMEHCPAHLTGKELNPKQIILGLRSYLNERGPRADEPLLGRHISQVAAFQCTTCGACESQCPVGIEHLPWIVGLRRGAVNTGKWDDRHGAELFLNLERHGNPFGISTVEREKFIRANGFPIYDGSQDYCLWLGCMGSYDPHGRETVLALVTLLERLKITFGVLDRERCTGDATRRLGNDLLFEELAGYNLKHLKNAGVRRLLSICPHCVRTIAEDWREYGEAPPIEHHSEFLARHRHRLGPPAQLGAVVYHDACYLGRYRDIYDEPRAVIGANLVQAKRSRERSFCCGAGGGLVFLGEEPGKRVGAERAMQLAATGADTVAAACPFCHTVLGDAFNAMPSSPRLLDIAQIAVGE